MPEINQYTLTHRELLELLIKHNNVHEGKWSLLVQLAMSAGMFGPTTDQTFPGVAVTFNQIGIQRASAGSGTDPQKPGVIILDAAAVNPKPKKARASRTKSKR